MLTGGRSGFVSSALYTLAEEKCLEHYSSLPSTHRCRLRFDRFRAPLPHPKVCRAHKPYPLPLRFLTLSSTIAGERLYVAGTGGIVE